uniref:hypothetical protein n=1 Tax=Peribacillus frigoritolerans TaxID=450367 RepID=UPI0020BEDCA8
CSKPRLAVRFAAEKSLNDALTKYEVEEIIVSLNLKNKKNQYITVAKFREVLEKYKYIQISK